MKAIPRSATARPLDQPPAMQDDAVFDPYQTGARLDRPSVCTACAAVCLDGRWHWTGAPPDALRVRCPACRRVRDKQAAAQVSVEGRFVREYGDELQLLVQTLEKRTRARYPMQRVMTMEYQPERLLITTTGIRLARSIGEALRQTYKGNLDFHYNEAEYLLRVRWQRWM